MTHPDECNINPEVTTIHLHPCPRCNGRSVYQSKSTFHVGVPGSGRVLEYRRCILCGNEFNVRDKDTGNPQENIHEVDLWKEVLVLRGQVEKMSLQMEAMKSVVAVLAAKSEVSDEEVLLLLNVALDEAIADTPGTARRSLSGFLSRHYC